MGACHGPFDASEAILWGRAQTTIGPGFSQAHQTDASEQHFQPIVLMLIEGPADMSVMALLHVLGFIPG